MTKTIGEVCRIIGGGTPSKKKPEYYEGDIPWASVRDMNVRVIRDTEYKITETAVAESATNIIPKGEVVISTHVGLGKVCVLGQDTAINQDLKAVIPVGDLSRWYLYYWFLSKADLLVANGKGATVKGVTVDFVKRLKINIPSLERQTEIVAALDAAQDLIDNSESQLAKLDQLVKSRFVEMFGDVSEVCKLSDETELITKGTTPTSLGFSFVDNGINFVKIETFSEDGSLLSNKVAHITEECHMALRRSQLKANDVLFSIAGAIGRVAVVDSRILPANTNQALAVIRLRIGARLIVPYLVEVLKSEVVSRQYMAMKQGVAQLNISLKNIGDFRIPVPTLALQHEFAAFVAEVDKSEFAVRKRLEKARQLYRAKLQEYFG